jgi:hypothetical protein
VRRSVRYTLINSLALGCVLLGVALMLRAVWLVAADADMFVVGTAVVTGITGAVLASKVVRLLKALV